MTIYVLCNSLVLWLCSRSQPGIKGQYKGPLGAFVTYRNISCFQIGFNLAGNQQRQGISIEFHYEQNKIMPLRAIGPCFHIGFNLGDNKGRHEISVNFDYGQNQIVQLRVTCPCLFMGISKMYIFKVT